ncbi:glycosyltransferase family 2 protein [Ideonella sp.]|uniref:glycosyltransferase family 2 protein n=1 Tax=Ideonella sp. TaxID=1929293 RepID=UPI0035B2DF77
MSFFRRRPAAAAGAAPALVRAHVDSNGLLSVSGWALGADGSEGRLELWACGQQVAATVRRCVRPDVLAHLGLEAGEPPLQPGFTLEVEASAWRALNVGDADVPVELRLDGRAFATLHWRLDDAVLSHWAQTVLDADPATQERDWPHLSGFLTDAQGRLEPRWAWVDEAWARLGGRPGQRVRGGIEHMDALMVAGWVSDPSGRGEHFEVRADEHVWPVTAARHERLDVAAGLPGASALSGFVLLWPEALWALLRERDEATLQLCVNGRPLLWPAWRATRVQWLTEAEAAQAKLAEVPAPERLEAAERVLLWRQRTAVMLGNEVGSKSQLADSAAGVPDDQRALWVLQRRFNEALDLGLLPAWHVARDQWCAQVAPSVWRRFAVSLVPTFCAAGLLDTLRPDLDESELATLAHSDGAWELSLLWPVALLDELVAGRLDRSAMLLERIGAALPQGWLNTASIEDGVRRVQRAAQIQALDDADLRRFVAALLTLYTRVGPDRWSRLHDRHLIDAMVELLALSRQLDDSSVRAVRQAALSLYGMVPLFWQRVAQHPQAELAIGTLAPPDLGRIALPPATDQGGEAHRAWSAALQALQHFSAWGAVDADLVRRHLLALQPPEWALDELAGADSPERLRCGLMDSDSAMALWRDLLPMGRRPMREACLRVHASEQAWQDAVSAQDEPAIKAAWARLRPDAFALARADAGFVGLPLLARAWQALPSAAPGPGGLFALAAELMRTIEDGVAMALGVLQRRRHEFKAPPAAVCAMLDWLGAAGSAKAQPLQAELAAIWQGWAELAAAPLPPTELEGWRAAVPGISALVVVRQSGAASAPARAARIANTWGRELQVQGASWCLWSADTAAVQVPDGIPVARQAHLFDLLAWLLSHTRFGHVTFVDDDVHLDVAAFAIDSGASGQHYHGLIHEQPSLWPGELPAVRFVDPGLGMTLSRAAVASALRLAVSRRGVGLRHAYPDEAVWLAQLLALAHLYPSDEGHAVHLRRPPEGGQEPALFHNLCWPAPGRAVVLTTVGDDEGLSRLYPAANDTPISPPRIWPPDQPPRLPGGALPSQQLVHLGGPAAPADAGSPCVIAVARNERVMLPHFLAHYRRLGVRRFVIADNLSTDGSREYLLGEPDVCLYSVDTPYRASHFGVAWQSAMLTAHAQRCWALVADIDELLVWSGCESEGLDGLCARLDRQGHDAALALMVDMYPQGTLDEADFGAGEPFDVAPWFDAQPVRPWRIGSGSYSNGITCVSAVRHRLLPDSPPNHYTAQKLPLMRCHAGVRLSEGLHYASGLKPAPTPVYFAHFKYHRGFRLKVEEEVARKQHYNDAEEYRKYRALWAEARGIMFDPAVSRRYTDSQSFADIPWN